MTHDPIYPDVIFDTPIEGEPTEDNPFGGITGLHYRYDWQRYPYWRVITLFREHFGLEIEKLWQGYKANRRPGYQELYRLRDMTTGEVIVPYASMRSLQRLLARYDFPEHAPAVKRNPGAEKFLEIVRLRQGLTR